MGLLEDIGATVKPSSGWRRQALELAMREPLASLVATWTRPIDDVVFRMSRGSTTMTGQISGFPVIWLTTTGARSGKRRRTPLLGIPTGSDDLAVFGTNFGQENTPGWAYNLRANPAGAVEFRGKVLEIDARIMGADEVEAVWNTASASAPTFAKYRADISNREVLIFELTAS
jgi:deazaflavin-dependent oxidoreductase (nitroreductase family)